MMTFVDTGGWYAIMVSTEPRHRKVLDWLNASSGPLITTDYVIDETLTLLRSRGEATRAVRFGRRIFDLSSHRVHYLRPDEIRRAWEVFRDQPEREWSFTDCTSKVVIERLHIKQALTFDHHFTEFGTLTLIP
jgi:uncharacterized protein